MNTHGLVPRLAWVFCLTVSAVQGAIFNYSYTFGDGLIVSGTLNGTQNGNFVDNVTGVTLFFNGVPVPGTIFTSRFDSSAPNQYVVGPIVSFNALLNNFVFSNSNLASGDFSYDSVFHSLSAAANSGFAQTTGLSIPLNQFGSQDLPTVAARWTLTAPPTGVPDGGGTIALLGIALAGLVTLRRRL